MNITGTRVNKEIMIHGVKVEGKKKIGNRLKKEIQKKWNKEIDGQYGSEQFPEVV